MSVQPIAHIFDMQRFCTHDGPGIRTTVFFKGCPLNCLWCSNPESQKRAPQLLYYSALCKGCGRCAAVCPQGAATPQGQIGCDRSLCIGCGACAEVCPFEAKTLSGRTVSLEEIIEFVRQDWRYYLQTGGGITCSGGEALMQADFLKVLFARLHDELGYHTCLDTTGHAPWEKLEALLPSLDLILLDIKHMDSEEHARMTGVGNERILDNARRLGSLGFPVLIRVPLIPGYNDTEKNIRCMAEFLRDQHFSQVELMPYHKFGQSKYQALGQPFTTFEGKPDVETAESILRQHGLNVLVHST